MAKDRRFVSDPRISSFWHFPQDRFDTTKHPINTNNEKPRYKLACLLSHQENQRLNGLINSLQVSEREAVRIAVYECCLQTDEELKPFLNQAAQLSKERGHTSRKHKLEARSTAEEKTNAQTKAQQLSITDKELIRLSIIWLGARIKDGSISRLTNSKRISDIECQKQWNKDTKGKPKSKKAEAFVTAREVGKAKAILEALRAQPEREVIKSKLYESGVLMTLKSKYPNYKNIKQERDAYYKELNLIIDQQIEDAQSEVILETAELRGKSRDEPILKSEAEIYLLMHALDVDYELAEWFYKDDQEEKEKLEKLPLSEQLLHYQNEIDRIKSYEDQRAKTARERKAEHDANLKAWSEEQAERNRLQAESLDGPTFLKAVQSDEQIGGMGTSDYGAGSNYGWRTIPPTTIWGRDKNHGRRCLVSNPAYEETIDSWQIDDGPPNTLV